MEQPILNKDNRKNQLLMHSKGVTFEEHKNGEIFLLNENTGCMQKLNKAAALVYKLCNNSFFDEAKMAYQKEYNKSEEQLLREKTARDFEIAVNLLLEKRLLRIEETSYNNVDEFENINIDITGVYLEITSMCNANCPYCYNSSNLHGVNIKDSIFYNLLDEIDRLEIKNITISGGEPSLHPSFISFLERCKSSNLHNTVITNAWFADDNQIINALKYSDVQITLDHIDSLRHDSIKCRGNFNAVKKTFNSLMKIGHNGKRIMRVNLVKKNMNFLSDFVNLGKKYNVTDINFYFLHRLGQNDTYGDHIDIDETPKIAKKILDELEYICSCRQENDPHISYNGCYPVSTCNLLLNNNKCVNCLPRITPTGQVFPCQFFSDSYFSIGYLTNDTLVDIINSNSMQELVRLINKRHKYNASCQSCVWKNICWKGCPARTFIKYNTIWQDSGDCDYWKKQYSNMKPKSDSSIQSKHKKK